MNDEISFTPRNITLDDETLKIVSELVNDRNFGPKGFSLAVRTIIREWDTMRISQPHGDTRNYRAPQPVA